MNRFERFASLAARVALAAIFVHSGWGKLADLAGTAAFIGSKGLPAPDLMALMAGVTELAGGLLLIVGFRTRLAAAVLAAFLVPTTLLFHNPLGLSGAEASMQMIQAYKNLAIFGGLLSTTAFGAGALSLDAALPFAKARRAVEAPARG